jgi:hypothetical protein
VYVPSSTTTTTMAQERDCYNSFIYTDCIQYNERPRRQCT